MTESHHDKAPSPHSDTTRGFDQNADESTQRVRRVSPEKRDIILVPRYVRKEEVKAIRERRTVMFGAPGPRAPRAPTYTEGEHTGGELTESDDHTGEAEKEQAASGTQTPPEEMHSEPAEDIDLRDTIGLALSGGGIRSASFNLGLLQALTDTGVMRWVDYMSTVSGGGFIGTYLSTLLCHPNVDKDKKGAYTKKLALVPTKQGQPKPVQQFIRGGNYLKAPNEIVDRFLIGFLLNGIVWVSFAIMVAVFLAFMWRMMDAPEISVWIRELRPWIGKYWRDWSRPFVPFLLLISLWAVTWLITYSKRRFRERQESERRFGKSILRYAWLSLFIGCAVLLATDDISLNAFGGFDETVRVNGHRVLGILFIVALILNLLPYLNPARLLRSELRPPGKREAVILKFAGAAFLLLLPFTLIYMFAREGIADYEEERGPEFVAADIPSPRLLLMDLQAAWQANGQFEGPEAPEDEQLGSLLYRTLLRNLHAPIDLTADANRDLQKGYRLDEIVFDDKSLFQNLDLFVEGSCEDDNFRSWYRSNKPSGRGRIAGEFIIKLLNELDPEAPSSEKSDAGPYSRRTWYQVRHVVRSWIANVFNCDILTKGHVIDHALNMSQNVASVSAKTDTNRLYVPVDEAVLLTRATRLRESDVFLHDLWPRAILNDGALPDEDRQRLNRLILEACYGNQRIEERTKCGLALSWKDDQVRRLYIFGISALVFVIFAQFVDLNSTSLHGFYRSKLRKAYVVAGTAGEDLKDLRQSTTKRGGPYHFICSTLNFFDSVPWHTTEFQSAFTFLFSPLFCGSQALEANLKKKGSSDSHDRQQPSTASPRKTRGYAKTDEYCGGSLDTATVAAISGAAFSPAVIRNPLMFFMFMLLNLRLGQWMPNPRRSPKDTRRRIVKITTILKDIFLTAFGKKEPQDWEYCFVTDGGHNDNLAVSPLIFRRSKLIIISDATRDPNYQFEDFLKVFRRYRIRGGMEFHRLNTQLDRHQPSGKLLDLSRLRPRAVDEHREFVNSGAREYPVYEESANAESLERRERRRRKVRQKTSSKSPDQCDQHFVLARLRYPEAERENDAVILYIKTSMTGDEPEDLRQYQIDNPQFPHDPTTDQFFTEDQVESYRQLGEHIGRQVCDTILHQLGHEDLWSEECNAFTATDIVNALLDGCLKSPASQAPPTEPPPAAATEQPVGAPAGPSPESPAGSKPVNKPK